MPEVVFRDITDDLIRDRVVVGLNSNDVRERLFRERDLTLDSALDIIRAIETAAEQQKKLTESSSVHSIKKGWRKGKYSGAAKNPQIDYGKKKGLKLIKCSKCGRKHKRFNCPAFRKKCHGCQAVGHLKAMCPKTAQVDGVCLDEESSHDDDSHECDSDTSSEYSEPGLLSQYRDVKCELITVTPNIFNNDTEINTIIYDWIEPIIFNSCKTVNCKIDTGAQSNVICKSVLKQIDTNSVLKQSNIRLTAFGGNKIETLGTTKLSLKLNNLELPSVSFIVVDIHCQTIIGLQTACKFKLVSFPSSARLCQIDSETSHSSERENVSERCESVVHVSTHSQPPIHDHCTRRSKVGIDSERVSVSTNEQGNVVSRVANKVTSQVVSRADCKDSGKKTRKVDSKTCKVDKDVRQNNKVVNMVSGKDTGSRASKVARGLHVKDSRESDDMPQCSERTEIQLKTRNRPVTGSLTPENLLKQYSSVFNESQVGLVQGKEYNIILRSDYVPVVHAARRLPFSTVDKVKSELDRMHKLKVIVPVDEPTEWVNSMTITHKPGGRIRICLDPTNLNEFILREHVHIPTPEELHTKLAGAKVFSKLDLKDGYWQIPLSERSSYLTTFNTPKGRYRYTRLPFGLSSANEVFQKRVSKAYEGLEGIMVLYDDVLVYGNNQAEHDKRLAKCLDRTLEVGIRLNKPKCKFRLSEVLYVGHVISSAGISPNPDRIQDVLNMPNPTDSKGCQRILGMLNYLAKYIPNMSELTYPIRQLLVKGTDFVWTFEQEDAMKKIKKVLTSHPVLQVFDVSKPVTLNTDASQHGAGACILQNGGPVAYASKSLTSTQQSYAQIEKELAAIVFGAERFYQYLYGKKVTVETDHKPLITILKRPIHQAPARCQRLLLRLQRFDLHPVYVPGKLMHISDALSRAVSPSSQIKCAKLEEETELMVHAVVQDIDCSDNMWSKISTETSQDPVLSTVKRLISNGWPDKITQCPESAKLYFNLRHQLTNFQDVILFNDWIVVPKSLHAELLRRLHVGHQGQERCKNLARKSIYWRGLNSDIDNMVRGCEACLLQRALPPRGKMISHKLPSRVWQELCADLFSYEGVTYQIIACFLSKWVEIRKFNVKHPSACHLIEHFKDLCSVYGIPNSIFSDNALYNSKEFRDFAKSYDIKLTNSSPYYAQSNGQIE